MPRRHKKQTYNPYRHLIACSSKRRFRNKIDADDAAEIQMLRQPSLELSTYQCNICKKWHLTRRHEQLLP